MTAETRVRPRSLAAVDLALEVVRLRSALLLIEEQNTPYSNATVRRMGRIAAAALRGNQRGNSPATPAQSGAAGGVMADGASAMVGEAGQ